MSDDALYEASGSALWAYVRAAAAGYRRGPAGTVAALADLSGVPRLGWVSAPSTVDLPTFDGRRVILASTGGWAFGVRVLCDALTGRDAVRVLDTLDPRATLRLLRAVGDPAGAAAVTVSASGRTTETRLLADTLTAWGAPPARLSELDGALSLTGERDQVALYGAPLSVPALLCAKLLGGDGFGAAYRVFADAAPAVGAWAGEVSRRLPREGAPRVVFRLPEDSGAGLRLWTLQAARQGWGGKSPTFRPWPDVDREIAPGGILVDVSEAVRLVVPAAGAGPCGALAGAMTAAYAVAAVVACVALRHGLRFTTHEAVDHYKRLLESAGGPDGAPVLESPDELTAAVAGWRRARPDLATVHIVGYGEAAAQAARAVPDDPAIEAYEGTAWNHHSYQAVWHTPSVGVIVLRETSTPDPTGDPKLDAALAAQARALSAIAGATHDSLAGRAHLLRWRPGTVPKAGVRWSSG